jgi:hypothetical protein
VSTLELYAERCCRADRTGGETVRRRGLLMATRLSMAVQWWAHLVGALQVHPHKHWSNYPPQEDRRYVRGASVDVPPRVHVAAHSATDDIVGVLSEAHRRSRRRRCEMRSSLQCHGPTPLHDLRRPELEWRARRAISTLASWNLVSGWLVRLDARRRAAYPPVSGYLSCGGALSAACRAMFRRLLKSRAAE